MAATISLTSYAGALKEYYTDDQVKSALYKDNPFLALVKKNTDAEAGGSGVPVPIKYGTGQGRGTTIAQAQTNAFAPKYARFTLLLKPNYATGVVDGQLLEAAKTKKEAFLNALIENTQSAMDLIGNDLASDLYRTVNGTKGKIATAGITSGVITLNDPSSVTQFEVGMTLQANSTEAGGTTRSGSPAYVVAVDRGAGTITMGATQGGAAASPTAWAGGDFLSVPLDYSSGKISGLQSWLPATAPDSTLFFGVDRSVDVTRLGGVRYDGSALPIEEAITQGAALVGREGGAPSKAFMSYASWTALELSLGSRVQYVDVKAEADVMFKGIRVNGPRGPIEVIPDRNCPGLTCFLITPDSFKLYSTGMVPKILDADGLTIARQATADAYEVRVGYYAQLGCNQPGANANITLGA